MTTLLDGITGNGAERRADEADRMAATSRLASTLVRKTADRHFCKGPGCRHRNCRRDTEHQLLLLEALGLAWDWAAPADYDSPLEWSSMSRGEATAMRGGSM